MQLQNEQLGGYKTEIIDLIHTWLPDSPTSGLRYFASLDKETLKGFCAVKCYMGHWYLRACVVKPEYRGHGLQRELMQECLEYLAEKTSLVRGAIAPDNYVSRSNTLALGFVYERNRTYKDGKTFEIYKKYLSATN